jgi:hypothetical protein
MKPGQVTTEMAARYFRLFVNRLAYTVQSHRPDSKGKHYYYRPRDARQLTRDTIREHLNGRITIGIYALNPKTQRSKWVAIDADYEDALDDLLKLQWQLGRDGVEAALEKSRRGAHLWIFFEKPLLARHCRIYIYNLARRLKVPVKGGAGLAEGIEVFPRQDELAPEEFGNAIRGPLGIHRGAGKRYWFYGADYKIEAQLDYLEQLKKITETEMLRFIAGLKCQRSFVPDRKSSCLPTTQIDASSVFLISSSWGRGGRVTIGHGARPAHSKEKTGAEITWPSRLPIRASTSAGLGARAR